MELTVTVAGTNAAPVFHDPGRLLQIHNAATARRLSQRDGEKSLEHSAREQRNVTQMLGRLL